MDKQRHHLGYDQPYRHVVEHMAHDKSGFILKNNNAYTRLRFAVSFTGLTYSHATGELTSTTDSVVVGSIDKPTAYYSDRPRVYIPVSSTYDGTYIEWSVDTTGASYPIYVDPTWTDGPSGDVTSSYDTWLAADDTTSNFGTNTKLVSGLYGDGGNDTTDNTIAIKFDISGIPTNSIIDSAIMSLWYYFHDGSQDDSHSIYRSLRAWSESQATWNVYTTGNSWSTAGGRSSGNDREASAIGGSQ